MDVLLWIGGEILLAILAVRIVLYAICVLLRVEETARLDLGGCPLRIARRNRPGPYSDCCTHYRP